MTHQFDLDQLVANLRNSDEYWLSFLEKPGFELGVLVLSPQQEDTQSPHSSDEVYFVISGNGFLRIKETEFAIKPNTAYYVPKDTPHHFHSNSKEIIAYYALN